MRALGLVFLTALVGCILVVSPEEYGTTCHFEGEDTQCGSCIATKCNAELHECCGDASCDLVMFDVDDCAAHSSYTCNVLKGTERRPLAECVKRRCDAVCVERKGTPTTSCREPRLGEGSACSCEANGEVNDVICNASAFPSTVCCAPKGWPAPGLACACRPLNCSPTNEGCFCSLEDFTPKQRECLGGGDCCVDKDVCTCRRSGCLAFERKVASCNSAEVGCADGQDRVESCSARGP